jgi:putative ABC transport system permease protein
VSRPPIGAGLVARVRSLWRGVRRRGDVEAEMAEEFRHHVELRAADLARQGLTPAEAARRARLEFGSVEMHKDAARAARGLRRLDDLRASALDFKLGFRMLAKYPGLTVVGGLAVAFGIATGAASFEVVRQLVRPDIPLAEGDRLVGVELWDAEAARPEGRALHDLAAWRGALRAVEELGAFRTVERNLITGEDGGRGEPVDAAEISASASGLARVAPLLGRSLVAADEQPGAPAVAVLGHEVWRRRFAGDSGVVGRTVRLGRTATTIVGVMPEGFAFPVAHRMWLPLRATAADLEPRRGPSVHVFGRLAPGVTLAEAQAELATVGARAAARLPQTHARLRPRVLPYARSVLPLPEVGAGGLAAADVFLAMLLVLVCGNVALLTFARAASREGEIVVRNALGAARGRIVAQLFAEALVLTGVASVAGLAAAQLVLRAFRAVYEAESGGRLPFWLQAELSPATLLYAAALAVLGAVIAGVVPALKVTRGLQARLRQSAAGGGGLRFGGVWTAVIVAQVAVTVAFPATAFFARRYVVAIRSLDVGFPAERYLSARLEMDREAPAGAPDDTSRAAFVARVGTVARELERRLGAEPGVVGVTFADRLPRTQHPPRRVEVDDAAVMADSGLRHAAGVASVDVDWFDVLGAPVRVGRAFGTADLATDAPPMVVNRAFVRDALGGRNPVGRRVRFAGVARDGTGPGPWYEIVGVAPDLGVIADDPDEGAGIYFPAAPGEATPLHLVVHLRGDPASFAPRLRTVATAVDPTLRLHDVLPLDQVGASLWTELAFLFKLLTVVSLLALLLSLAGIYAVMAFAVSRRTREIGVRVALGAPPQRVVGAVFARPMAQVVGGLAAGAVLVLLLTRANMRLTARELAWTAAYMALMLGVCLVACVVPTRRALRVEPTEALRADG